MSARARCQRACFTDVLLRTVSKDSQNLSRMRRTSVKHARQRSPETGAATPSFGRNQDSGCGVSLDDLVDEVQSSGGLPRASILAKTVYGSVLLPEYRKVRSSFIHA